MKTKKTFLYSQALNLNRWHSNQCQFPLPPALLIQCSVIFPPWCCADQNRSVPSGAPLPPPPPPLIGDDHWEGVTWGVGGSEGHLITQICSFVTRGKEVGYCWNHLLHRITKGKDLQRKGALCCEENEHKNCACRAVSAFAILILGFRFSPRNI